MISRRDFLGASAAAAVASALCPESVRRDEPPDCVLLAVPAERGLEESLAGFEAALEEAGVRFVNSFSRSSLRCRTIIVPASTSLSPTLGRQIVAGVEKGAWALVESGAGFHSPDEFRRHQRMLESCFDVETGLPIDLWKGDSRRRSPYVDYTWPVRAKIRDFSRVIPVSRKSGDIICNAGEFPLGVKRRVGGGYLIFLGSPLGPALRAGDREARRWLGSLVSCV